MTSPKEDGQDSKQRVVSVEEGPEVGYFGHRPRTEPNENFTVAGVTGGTANVNDTPKSVEQS